MDLSFTDQKMLLASVNARAEVHGEEREPAGDVKLEADLPNSCLSLFHPTLKSLLYCFDSARPQDLADQGKAHEPGYLPHLRFPNLVSPLRWDAEVANAQVTISVPGVRGEIVLSSCKVNKFEFTPHDGGTVSIAMRVQCHPDEKAFGKLSVIVQQEVSVTLEIVEQAPA